jgi:hypothetical protein
MKCKKVSPFKIQVPSMPQNTIIKNMKYTEQASIVTSSQHTIFLSLIAEFEFLVRIF